MSEQERAEIREKLRQKIQMDVDYAPWEDELEVQAFILGNQIAYLSEEGRYEVYYYVGNERFFRITVHPDDDVTEVMLDYAVDQEMKRRHPELKISPPEPGHS